MTSRANDVSFSVKQAAALQLCLDHSHRFHCENKMFTDSKFCLNTAYQHSGKVKDVQFESDSRVINDTCNATAVAFIIYPLIAILR